MKAPSSAFSRSLLKLGFKDNDLLLERHYAVLANKATSRALAGCCCASPREVREAIRKVYGFYDREASSRWSLRPEVKATILKIKDLGITIGLVTNVGTSVVEEVLSKVSLEGMFEVIATRDDVLMLKQPGMALVQTIVSLIPACVCREGSLMMGISPTFSY